MKRALKEKAMIDDRRFAIRNLDCAACGAKLEAAIKKVDGVEEAVLDFAGLTLHLKARDIEAALAEARRIEPSVGFFPVDTAAGQEASGNHEETRWGSELAILGLAAILFGLLLLMDFELVRPPAAPLRLTMVGVAYLLAG